MPTSDLARYFRSVRRLTTKREQCFTLPILRACPNLVAYIQCSGKLDVGLLKLMLEVCGSSLRYLQTPQIAHPGDIFPLLAASAPGLEWLEIDTVSASS